jgi:hypothetical protein
MHISILWFIEAAQVLLLSLHERMGNKPEYTISEEFISATLSFSVHSVAGSNVPVIAI